MCGIVAVCWLEWKDSNIPKKLGDLLHGSRNRWQTGYWVAVLSEWKISRHVWRELGWVTEVLNKYKWRTKLAIGHARYDTSGPEASWDSALQPFPVKTGELEEAGLSFAFNGNIVNAEALAVELRDKGFTFEHDPILDTEVLKYMIEEQSKKWIIDLKIILEYIHNKIDGCCNIIIIDKTWNMAVAKDKWGFRPLVYGIKDGLLFVASESTALNKVGCDVVTHISNWEILQVHPGEIAPIKEKMTIEELVDRKRCIFEMIYFANNRTVLWKETAAAYRYRFGQLLWENDIDRFSSEDTIIVDIPSSSEEAAKWYADRLNIRRVQAITINPEQRENERTFIAQWVWREEKVKNKYLFNPSLKKFFKWKKVILMDDSIVRWTTLEHLVQSFQEFYEPAEIHIRIPSPPVVAPCFYGINMADVDTLLAPKFFKDIQNPTEDELRNLWKSLWVNSLRYLTIPSLVTALKIKVNDLCLACLTGDYPTKCGQETYNKQMATKK